MNKSKTSPFEVGFPALTYESFVSDLTAFLKNKLEAPEFDELLFYDDETFVNLPPKKLFRRQKVPREILYDEVTFKARFQKIREAHYSWIHVRILGVAKRKMIVQFVTPESGGGELPSPAPIRVTKYDAKPDWDLV